MPNLTEKDKIVIKKGTEISIENGYDLVVSEDNKFRVYQEGQLPEKKGWNPFKKAKVIEVFAVSTDDRHEVTTKKPVAHSDGVHNFLTNISIRFSVSDPIMVVKQLRKDPVERLKEETGKIIIGFLKASNWEEIKNPQKFAQLKNNALEQLITTGRSEVVPMFDKIAEHAQSYGLKISEINFEVVIAEEDLEVEIKKDKFGKEKLIATAEADKDLHVDANKQKVLLQNKDFEGQIRDKERREKLKDQITNTAANYMDKVGGNIAEGSRSIEDVQDALEGVFKIQERISEGGASNFLQQDNERKGRVGLLSSGKSVLNSFSDVLNEIKAANLEVTTQKKLLGTIFHMVGAKLLNAPDEKIRTYILPLKEVEISQELQEYIFAKWKEVKTRIDNNNII